MPNITTAHDLRNFAQAVIEAHGVPSADAHLLSDSLVAAELWGHSSHGMLRLPWYIERLRSGVMQAVTRSEVVIDNGALLVIDGHEGIGQVLTAQATQLGIERAKKHGVSAVGVRNSNHFGTAAYFTRMSAQAGCVGILTTNASPAMPAWGGKKKLLGTNPWSIAAPAGSRGVAVMDMANTAVARGKIYLAAERGEPIPASWAADEHGRPTTNAADALQGLILPMAGHKGYVLAFMMDVLSGVLTGSNFGTQVVGPYVPDRRSGCGHLLITIDVNAMMPLAAFNQRMETLIDEIKDCPLADGVQDLFFPGELEDVHSQAHLQAGLQIADKTWESLQQLGADTHTAMPQVLQTI
jgi:LDH2 family malate/lactate/ureidoglycolate dehydrogenase